MNTARHDGRDDSLQVDAARKRRLMDTSNRGAYEAEWRDFLRECRDEVEAVCRWQKHSPEDAAEIQHLVVQRLPSIVEAFDPDRGSGAGFRTFLRKPIKFAIKDYFRFGATDRTEVGVFSAPERVVDGDGSGAAEVPRIARDVLIQTWDESTPVTSLEEIEEKNSWKSRAALFVANSRFSRQEKRFFKHVELDHRAVVDVAAEACVEVGKVIEAVDRVRRAVEREVPKETELSSTSDQSPPTRQVESVRVSIASPKQIRAQSSGEVCVPKTLDPRSLKPVRGGLMCERIFGPMRDWGCDCEKSHGPAPPGSRCPRCGMELLPASARRQRMGHIELAAPVLNGWLFKENASLVCQVLGMNRSEVDALIYRQGILVLAEGSTTLRRHQVLDDKSLKEAQEIHGPKAFKWGIGAAALRGALAHVDLGQRLAELEAEMAETTCRSTRMRCLAWATRLKSFIESDQRLEWMVMEVLPVLPAGLRPEIPIPVSQVELDQEVHAGRKVAKHRFATSDLNRLYRRVLVENRRVKELREACAPEAIVYHRITSLQKAVDALLHVGRSASYQRRELKPLVQCLEGKGGRFRGNLLGKRVDYSGRAVIVVGPELKLHQCGIPLKLGVKLFEPLLVRRLKRRGFAATTKDARRHLDSNPAQHRSDLEAVAKGKLVLLNRAPTLHRLSVQAFEPVFVPGDAIQLHPMACAAFGADFDGDQMAVHLPLSERAQAEARSRMMARSNLLSPGNGRPIIAPSQDIVLGCFYLTLEPRESPTAASPPMLLGSKQEALFALESGHLKLHDRIRIPNPDHGYQRPYGVSDRSVITTTAGRVVFNDALPEDLGFVNEVLNKEGLTQLVATCRHRLGVDPTLDTLDRIKAVGFRAATRAGVSVGIEDLIVPAAKTRLIEAAREAESLRRRQRDAGAITDRECRDQVLEEWRRCTDAIKKCLLPVLAANDGRPGYNPLWLMLQSKARGSSQQVIQMTGMRGIMVKASGEFCEHPVTSNFREGLSLAEYFVSTFGARKGISDRSLATRDSGYLTRKLVHAVRNVVVTEPDCGSVCGRPVTGLVRKQESLVPLSRRIVGRVAVADVSDPKDPSKVLLEANTEISAEMALHLEQSDVPVVVVRSVLTCQARRGVCSRCYGWDPSNAALVVEGLAVGVVAAQSVGEPGTQLTMRTFHLGGVATGANALENDITGGLPRVNELLEARRAKNEAVIAPMDGTVSVQAPARGGRVITIYNQETCRRRTVRIPAFAQLRASAGDLVANGDRLTDGPLALATQLAIGGLGNWQASVVDEVLAIYAAQGAVIADQHLEIIVREMSRRVQITEPGNSGFHEGELADRNRFNREVERLQGLGKQPPVGTPVIVGIGKLPALADSFLAAAAFERTGAILAKAALSGKPAVLTDIVGQGITGGVIPAGTGFDPQEAEADRPVRHPRRGQQSSRKGKANDETH